MKTTPELPHTDCEVAKEGIIFYCHNTKNAGYCIHGSFETPPRCRHRLSYQFPRVEKIPPLKET